MNTSFTASEVDSGQRLDVFLSARITAVSRTVLQKAITAGDITVNGQAVKPRYALRAHDEILVGSLQAPAQEAITLEPLELPIIYEDKSAVVINKPAGVVVHPGVGQEQQTVSSWFYDRYPSSRDVGEEGRAGIVHRLDKDTSGVMILAKTKSSLEHLKAQFKNRRARKEYLALVFGVPKDSKGRITRPLARSKRNPMRRTVDEDGKRAVTEWFKEESLSAYSLLRVLPLTGRTHQIRVHLHYLGYPIVGDALYTFKRKSLPKGVNRQLLHAEKLKLQLESGARKTFVAPLSDDFTNVLQQIRSAS